MNARFLTSISLAALLVVTVSFQACHPILFTNSDSSSGTPSAKFASNNTSQGNGDSYGGKLTVYNHLNVSQPCAERGKDGRALPNAQIFISGPTTALLVRDNCADLDTPVAIQMSDLQFLQDGTGDILYQNQRFAILLPQLQNDLSTVAANCPAGLTPIASPNRTNLMQSSQLLTDTNVWWNHIGIGTSLDGSFGGLLRFEISRNDAGNLDYWRRIHQSDFPLTPNRTYAYSFLAKPKAVNEAMFSLSVSGISSLSLIFNLQDGSYTEQQRLNIPNYSVTSVPFSNGRFYTVYFTMPATTASSVIGITPNGILTTTAAVGDSISATAVQLEDVSTFCTP